ncbi:MAG: hypothetical protein HZB66_01250 [Candidatus Aenigmarchaeota archaeon]|nr:hypothetical protein [Candidatus Aenigmarchaeota archaeon]
MFVIDDVFLLPLSLAGFEPLPNLIMMSFRAVHKNSLQELYPLKKTQNEIKEIALLYELGELPREEYKKRTSELAEKLRIAQRVNDINIGQFSTGLLL